MGERASSSCSPISSSSHGPDWSLLFSALDMAEEGIEDELMMRRKEEEGNFCCCVTAAKEARGRTTRATAGVTQTYTARGEEEETPFGSSLRPQGEAIARSSPGSSSSSSRSSSSRWRGKVSCCCSTETFAHHHYGHNTDEEDEAEETSARQLLQAVSPAPVSPLQGRTIGEEPTRIQHTTQLLPVSRPSPHQLVVSSLRPSSQSSPPAKGRAQQRSGSHHHPLVEASPFAPRSLPPLSPFAEFEGRRSLVAESEMNEFAAAGAAVGEVAGAAAGDRSIDFLSDEPQSPQPFSLLSPTSAKLFPLPFFDAWNMGERFATASEEEEETDGLSAMVIAAHFGTSRNLEEQYHEGNLQCTSETASFHHRARIPDGDVSQCNWLEGLFRDSCGEPTSANASGVAAAVAVAAARDDCEAMAGNEEKQSAAAAAAKALLLHYHQHNNTDKTDEKKRYQLGCSSSAGSIKQSHFDTIADDPLNRSHLTMVRPPYASPSSPPLSLLFEKRGATTTAAAAATTTTKTEEVSASTIRVIKMHNVENYLLPAPSSHHHHSGSRFCATTSATLLPPYDDEEERRRGSSFSSSFKSSSICSATRLSCPDLSVMIKNSTGQNENAETESAASARRRVPFSNSFQGPNRSRTREILSSPSAEARRALSKQVHSLNLPRESSGSRRKMEFGKKRGDSKKAKKEEQQEAEEPSGRNEGSVKEIGMSTSDWLQKMYFGSDAPTVIKLRNDSVSDRLAMLRHMVAPKMKKRDIGSVLGEVIVFVQASHRAISAAVKPEHNEPTSSTIFLPFQLVPLPKALSLLSKHVT